MKAPLSWLREYVDIDVDAKTLADWLTFAGVEVEGIEQTGIVPEKVIVGEIISVEPHANADQLVVCIVNNGVAKIRVVCGAKNCTAGDRAPLAMIGAALSNGVVVREQTVRGVVSQGMLCAEDEIGLSQDHSGIMILPAEARVGRPVAEVLGPPDQVLNLEITPNRPDLLGMIGIARDVAALSGKKLKKPSFVLHEDGQDIHSLASVAVEDAVACPRYNARVLTNAVMGQSPFWLRRRLALAGIRSVNNIVDITNYVLLECGQPLHAFDLKLLSENRIIVRRAKKGEKIIALDGIEYKLDQNMLVIADASDPLAIAGVMGGEKSGIQQTTASILLESACFKPALIRRTSKAIGLASESSYRFERGVDISQVDWASRRACALMASIAGAKIARGSIDIFAKRPEAGKITCRYGRVNSLLGMNVPSERIVEIFGALDMPVGRQCGEHCVVLPPTFRPDIEIEADLIEEIARIHGLDKIPLADPRCHAVAGADDKPARAQFHCRRLLAALGLREIMNYSFVSEKLLDMFDKAGADKRVVIPRPVSADQAILRDSLLPQMVETLGRNRSRQVEEAAFFEMGRVFSKRGPAKLDEETRIAIGLMGAVCHSVLQKRKSFSDSAMFSWLKGILANFYAQLAPSPAKSESCHCELPAGLTIGSEPGGDAMPWGMPLECFKPDRFAVIALDGVPCGGLGILKDEVRREWRILEPVGLMELRMDPFLKRAFETPSAGALPVYPSVTRDIALRVSSAVRHADVAKIIWKKSPKELTSVDLFDIYSSKEIGAGFKSMAYSLKYQSLDRTLTDDEVNRLHEAVKTQLKNELQVEIREG